MSSQREGATALVTGGALGIGAETVRELVAAGNNVVIADIDLDAARRLATELGDRATAVRADVRDPSDCDAMAETAVSIYGGLDLAVNCAGVLMAEKKPLAETRADEWERITQVDLTGVFHSMQAEIPRMLERGGAIINVASAVGMVGSHGRSPYVAAKHGVVGLTKTAAIEYAQRGIRINAVGPGGVNTPALAYQDEEARAAIAASHPIGRLATPQEIAQAIVVLLSPSLTFMTGAFIPLDGGYLAQ